MYPLHEQTHTKKYKRMKRLVYKDSLYQEACVDPNGETGGHD